MLGNFHDEIVILITYCGVCYVKGRKNWGEISFWKFHINDRPHNLNYFTILHILTTSLLDAPLLCSGGVRFLFKGLSTADNIHQFGGDSCLSGFIEYQGQILN
jgi:hypothetical protein